MSVKFTTDLLRRKRARMSNAIDIYRRTSLIDIANHRERRMTIDDDDLDEYSRRRFPQNSRVDPEQRDIMNALGRYFIDHVNTNRAYCPPIQQTAVPIPMNIDEELENRLERLARRERNQSNFLSNTGIVFLGILFILSCIIRYILEVFSNTIIASFR
jgi:hypothetical protein